MFRLAGEQLALPRRLRHPPKQEGVTVASGSCKHLPGGGLYLLRWFRRWLSVQSE
jgi:hypothetical protein